MANLPSWPVVEHGSPVWEPTPEDPKALERIQTGVLRRMVSCNRNVADDALRLELGCRPLASWVAQHKLEYAYRLHQQGADRLPRRVSEACWLQKRKRDIHMHAEIVTNGAAPQG